MAKPTTKQNLTKNDAKIAAKALEVLFTTRYISKFELYKENFIRGIFFSAGTIFGATVIVAVAVWVLSIFHTVPVIGPLVNDIIKTIENTQTN